MPKTALKPDQKPQRKKFDHRGAGTIRPIPRLANAGPPPINLRSSWALRISSRLSRLNSSSMPHKQPDNSRKDRSRDAYKLRMQSWQSKISGRCSSGKSEMVPVGINGISLGQYHHRAIYTDAEIEEVFALHDAGFRISEIARKMEMPTSTVSAICSGKLRGKTPTGWKRKKV